MLFLLLAGCVVVLSATNGLGVSDFSGREGLTIIDGPVGSLLAAAGMVTVYLAVVSYATMRVMLGKKIVRVAGGHAHLHIQDRVLNHYATVGTAAKFLLFFLYAALIYQTDFAPTVFGGLSGEGGVGGWPLVASFALLSPFLLAIVLGWIVQWPADKIYREDANEAREKLNRPQRPAWTFRAYMGHHLTQHMLFVMLPMSFILLAADLSRIYRTDLRAVTLPVPGRGDVALVWLDQALIGVAACAVFVFVPLLIRWLWNTRPLPAGELRDRLEGIAARYGVRYRDILIWDTDGRTVNAAVIGLLGPLRYVMLSDALLTSLERRQVEAVFAHELGHLVHRHIYKLVAFSIISMSVVGAAVILLNAGLSWLSIVSVGTWLAEPMASLKLGLWSIGAISSHALDGPEIRLTQKSVEMLSVLLLVGVWALFFGAISRLFERQADYFGALQVGEPTPMPVLAPNDAPRQVHDGPDGAFLAAGVAWVPQPRSRPSSPQKPQSLTPLGTQTFTAALDRVVERNHMDRERFDWRHGSIRERVEHLSSLQRDASHRAAFARQLSAVDWLLGVGVVLCIVGSVWLHLYQPTF